MEFTMTNSINEEIPKILPLPKNPNLDFFAYGFLKKGELDFNIIKELVAGEPAKDSCRGTLYEKDGVPIFASEGERLIPGQVIHFKSGREGYELINKIEPAVYYEWGTKVTNGGKQVNVLTVNQNVYDRFHKNVKGAVISETEEWHCSSDPLFNKGMQFLKESYFDRIKEIETNCYDGSDNEYARVFEMQMAYMFLWSIIDRHNTLKYKLGSSKLSLKNDELADDKYFIDSLKLLKDHFLTKPDEHVYDSSKGRYCKFVIEDFKRAPELYAKDILNFYYQIRNNAVHRGKISSVCNYRDFNLLKNAFLELYAVMANVISKGIKQGEEDLSAINVLKNLPKSNKGEEQ